MLSVEAVESDAMSLSPVCCAELSTTDVGRDRETPTALRIEGKRLGPSEVLLLRNIDAALVAGLHPANVVYHSMVMPGREGSTVGGFQGDADLLLF